MVIPIGGLGIEPLSGPPPPELAARFKVVKMCVLGLLTSLAGEVLLALMTGNLLGAMGSNLNLILLCLTGVFLLNDDEHFKLIYNFVIGTCLQPCAEHCPGGMSCLLNFVIMSVLSAVMDVLLNNALGTIFTYSDAILSGKTTSGHQSVVFLVFVMSATCALLSEIVGAWYGWKAYSEARDLYAAVPGSWAEEQRQNQSSGAGGDGLWGGGWVGGGGGAAGAAEAGGAGGGGGRPAQGFQVFQGTGNRLGGE